MGRQPRGDPRRAQERARPPQGHRRRVQRDRREARHPVAVAGPRPRRPGVRDERGPPRRHAHPPEHRPWSTTMTYGGYGQSGRCPTGTSCSASSTGRPTPSRPRATTTSTSAHACRSHGCRTAEARRQREVHGQEPRQGPESARELHGELRKVGVRYEKTGPVLVTYAVGAAHRPRHHRRPVRREDPCGPPATP